MRNPAHPRMEDVELVEVLRALGDPVRLQIFARLTEERELTCGPLAQDLGLPKSTLSHHLKILRECGITVTIPDGVHRRVRLRTDELEDRFAGLVQLLATLSVQARQGAPTP